VVLANTRKRRVLVCQGLFCSARGSQQLLGVLQARLAECAGVVVEPYYCFNGCSHGPNVVVHADRAWYEGVTPGDVATIVEHAITGQAAAPAEGRVPPVVRTNAFEALDRKYPAEP
jgi:(2Fe-2S) ferredoxin